MLKKLTHPRAAAPLLAYALLYLVLPLLGLALPAIGPSLELTRITFACLFVIGMVGLPLALNGPRWVFAVWLALLGVNSFASQLSLVLTNDFITAASAGAAVQTTVSETATLILAAGPLAWAVCALWLLQVTALPLWLRATSPAQVRRAGLKGPAITQSRLRIFPVLLLALPLGVSSLMHDYPLGTLDAIQAFKEGGRMSASIDHAQRFQAKKESSDSQLVVFVIGESSQAEYWQIYGYDKDTSPLLVKRHETGELLAFARHMSTAQMTRLAVPGLLNAFDQIQVGPNNTFPPSLITLMQEAGFGTAWLTTQALQPQATEAQSLTALNEGTMWSRQYDDRLIPVLSNWLDTKKSGNEFVVLHTMGSHLPFEGRYPAAFAKWDASTHLAYPFSETETNYANTVLYTDWFLDSVISRLSQDPREVLMVYVSDHGETLMNGKARTTVVPSKDVLHVPFMIWANKDWRQAHASRWEALARIERSRAITSHLNVVPTLATALGVDYPRKPLVRDLLSKEFKDWTTTPALNLATKQIDQVAPPP